MKWVFPGHDSIDEQIPERTSLQRKMKEYLLKEEKAGVAKGHWKEFE